MQLIFTKKLYKKEILNMKKKYSIRKLRASNDAIIIKKKTILKLITSLSISWVIYNFNEKLDLITL